MASPPPRRELVDDHPALRGAWWERARPLANAASHAVSTQKYAGTPAQSLSRTALIHVAYHTDEVARALLSEAGLNIEQLDGPWRSELARAQENTSLPPLTLSGGVLQGLARLDEVGAADKPIDGVSLALAVLWTTKTGGFEETIREARLDRERAIALLEQRMRERAAQGATMRGSSGQVEGKLTIGTGAGSWGEAHSSATVSVSSPLVREAQLLLQRLEASLSTNGVLDDATQASLQSFCAEAKLSWAGTVDEPLLQALRTQRGGARDERLLDVFVRGESTVAGAGFDRDGRLWIHTGRALRRYARDAHVVEQETVVRERSLAHFVVQHPNAPADAPIGFGVDGGDVFSFDGNGSPTPIGSGAELAPCALASGDCVFARSGRTTWWRRGAAVASLPNPGHAEAAPLLAMAATQTAVFAQAKHTVERRDLAAPSNLSGFNREKHVAEYAPGGLAVSNDGTLVAALTEGCAIFDAVQMGLARATYGANDATSRMTAIGFTRDGRHVLVGYEDGVVDLVDWGADEWVDSWKAHANAVRSFATDAKGRVLTTSADGTVKLWKPDLRAQAAVRLDSDLTHGDAPPMLERDVRALSRVLLAKELTPPISVGLFGDWGSGKSFFIHHLIERIKKDAESATKGETTDVVENVVNVTFNAWHYAESNLWAALMTHLFDVLGEKLKTEHKVEEGELHRKLEDVQGALKEAKARDEAAKNQLVDATHKLSNVTAQRKETEAAQAELTGSMVLSELASTFRRELAAAKTPKDAKVVIDAWKERWAAARRVGPRIVEAFAICTRRPLVPLLLIAIALVVVLVSVVVDLGTIATVASRIVAVATPVVAFARMVGRPMDAALDFSERAVAALQPLVERAKEEKKEKNDLALDLESKAAADVIRLQDEEKRTTAGVIAAQENVRIAQEAIIDASAGRTLYRFIAERSGTSDYRQHLGMLSLIRRDLGVLSKMILRPREKADPKPVDAKSPKLVTLDGKSLEVPEPIQADGKSVYIDRILLYVDDLDRCPPKRVVEVLEAVHLLLGIPLFVVVVAVDSRWLMRSLREHYGRLLPNDQRNEDADVRATTPRQFLEKIFQLAINVRPLDDALYGAMLAQLAPKPVETSAPRRAPALPGTTSTTQTPANPGANDAIQTQATASASPTTQTTQNAQTTHNARTTQAAPARVLEQRVPRLRLTAKEHEALTLVAGTIHNARGVKTLLNTYRLLRARLEIAEDDEPSLGALIHGRAYGAVIFLLSIQVTGGEVCRELAADLSTDLPVGRIATEALKTSAYFESNAARSDAWKRVAAVVALLRSKNHLDDEPETLRTWLKQVERFSFERWSEAGRNQTAPTATTPPRG